MAEAKPNGGHAFPVGAYTIATGMTVRDYFAAKAMQAMVFDIRNEPLAGSPKDLGLWAGTAKAAYEMADAMLEARK